MLFEAAGPVRVTRLDLHRGMVDVVAVMQFLSQLMQESVTRMAVGHDEVHGKGRFRSAHRPDMQIVDILHAGQGAQIFTHRTEFDIGRHAVEGEAQRLAEQAPGRVEDKDRDDEA